jgi:hypothetical protein
MLELKNNMYLTTTGTKEKVYFSRPIMRLVDYLLFLSNLLNTSKIGLICRISERVTTNFRTGTTDVIPKCLNRTGQSKCRAAPRLLPLRPQT